MDVVKSIVPKGDTLGDERVEFLKSGGGGLPFLLNHLMKKRIQCVRVCISESKLFELSKKIHFLSIFDFVMFFFTQVIQRERESVINCRSPDCYSSRIEKFSKMRQFRHSANKMSNRSLNNPATFTRPNDQAPEMTVSNTEIRIEDASDPEFNVI